MIFILIENDYFKIFGRKVPPVIDLCWERKIFLFRNFHHYIFTSFKQLKTTRVFIFSTLAGTTFKSRMGKMISSENSKCKFSKEDTRRVFGSKSTTQDGSRCEIGESCLIFV